MAGLIACWSVWITPAIAAAPTEQRPNIVVFLVDDLGWQDTSVPFGGEITLFNRHFRTPNLERLARQGTRFVNAYACAVCSPTRTSLMTGQNAARHRVTNWTLYPDRETSGTTPNLLPPPDWKKGGLQPGVPTLPLLLREAGYFTIHAGKAHWGAVGTPGSDPLRLGFDVNIAGHAAGGPGDYRGEANYGNAEPGAHTLPWGIPGLAGYHGTSTHLTEATTAEALKAVDSALEQGRPFYLYLAHYAVHAPLQPHQRYLDHYRGKNYPGTDRPIPEPEANYASMVEGVDASLGSVLDHLEERGVAERTIVVFASDNGGLSIHSRGTTPRGTGANTHCWPLREGKGSAYEGGTRVPFVVAWARPDPNQRTQQQLPVMPGTTTAAPLIIEDLYPTLLRWAGTRSPADWPVDGRDFTGALLHPSDSPVARPLLFHYPHQWTGRPTGGYQPHSALRFGDWKVIYFYEDRRWELYDLAHDLGEARNLADLRPDVLKNLADRMMTELAVRDALYPAARSTGEPVRPVRP